MAKELVMAPGHVGTQRQPTTKAPQFSSWGFPENPSTKMIFFETLLKKRMHSATSLLADR